MPSPTDELSRLLAIMARLRDPETGCAWDVEQTFATIAPYTIEEAYEVADAIQKEDWAGLKGELGDLLLQAVYHAQMAKEAGYFDFGDMAKAVSDKMVARHPHVFGSEEVRSAEEQTRAWEAQKARERGGRTLDGVALALPALKRAEKLQARAARVGFDWPDARPVLDKIAEEAREVWEARDEGADRVEEEMGDLLFVCANLARWLGVDPEAALRRANAKFERRFAIVEDRLKERGRTPAQSTLDEMDAIWNEVRAADKA
ncbi:Nucleoside triphosphate pyrophosphohydrolase MazG [Rubellimicrobium mesophilum DSM 19309]|uniref:Nucleoside triphosphate pyrophosphohydrolase n=1 Tax=Rubellimicrobium mesophilum DSM 19309 TaxID=442562 RepID=A0A017HR52_9RHOB|nr:nucleoside triphosphate pyrophosphohydrolase [Rubellimicrobium mesophilum]EYD76239.1 Nucleoside triphosphate pyrophosphohydrolase MazG [Rubellimicrobium mesophilum DSM 19309]